MRGLLRFVPSEIDTMARSLLAKEQEAARERMAAGGKGGLKLVKASRPSLTLDAIGRRFDISGRQLRKIMDVCEAAAADPDSGMAKGMRAKLDAAADYLDAALPVVRVARDAPVQLSGADALPTVPVDAPALAALADTLGIGRSVTTLTTALAAAAG